MWTDPQEFTGPLNVVVTDTYGGAIEWTGNCPVCGESLRYFRYTEFSADDQVVKTFLPCAFCDTRSELVFTRRVDEVKSFIAGMIGTWEVDGDLYLVYPSLGGGLDALSLTTGRAVGAGLVFGGRRVGPLPEDFKKP